MKAMSKPLLSALAACALFAALPALAEPAAAPPAAPPEAGQPNCPWKDGKGAWMEQKLETLHAALKLAPAQEAAWAEWSAKAKAAKPDWHEQAKELEDGASLPAVQRMEKRLAKLKERLAKWEELLAATKAFYATLSPEQKQTFDQQWAFKPHRQR